MRWISGAGCACVWCACVWCGGIGVRVAEVCVVCGAQV